MKKRTYQTTGRLALVAYLKKERNQAPQSAAEIFEGLCREGGAAARSSVYRMLAALCAEGAVRKFREGTGSNGYVYQYVGEGDCSGHLHLQCLSCGKIEHLACRCSADISRHLMATHHFAVDSGASVLYGTCAACGEAGRNG